MLSLSTVFASYFPSATSRSIQGNRRVPEIFRKLKKLPLRIRQGKKMLNMLIVDDQPHMQQFLCEELIDEGYSVEYFATERVKYCNEDKCSWRGDCLSINNNPKSSPR